MIQQAEEAAQAEHDQQVDTVMTKVEAKSPSKGKTDLKAKL